MADMLIVNGSAVKCPSVFQWGKQDISEADSGRDQTGLMYKNKLAEKVTIGLAWNGVSDEAAHLILQAFADEYFNVTYYDPLLGYDTTKEFYCGDMSAPVYRWWDETDGRYYENVTFNIIER
jgi:hypothetical protein